jgi:hypothetical protein
MIKRMVHSSFPSGSGTVTEDGSWCWFQDPRAVFWGNRLWVGYVSTGDADSVKKGRVSIAEVNLKTGRTREFVLHQPKSHEEAVLWADDHNSPAFAVISSRLMLAFYTKHSKSNEIFTVRIRKFFGRAHFEKQETFIPSEDSRVCYSNPVNLSSERRVFNFFRGLRNTRKPSCSFSDSLGKSWVSGGILVDLKSEFKHRPYLKLDSNGRDQIDFAVTEGHPREYPNSIYHFSYKSAVGLLDSHDRIFSTLAEGVQLPTQGTKVFNSRENESAWVITVNRMGNEVFILFSLRRSTNEKTRKDSDLSYHLARFTDGGWSVSEIADAGPQLYQGEDDYSGLAALHPTNPKVVFISTKVDPGNNVKTRKWELYKGTTYDFVSWSWIPVTKNSRKDNIRPLCVSSPRGEVVLLWLEGEKRSFKDYDFCIRYLTDL